MRQMILDTLRARMRTDSSIFFITADMGINLVECFEEEFPDRFLNVGIAEQNAVGVAAGLANVGFRPWVYTISNFLVHRCFEQLRNDAALHQYPITLVGTSTGYDNAPLGPTHHIIDDWGLVAGIPGTTVYTPSTVEFAETLVDRVLKSSGTHYVRIPKGSMTIPGSGFEEVTLLGQGDPSETLVISYGGVGARLAEDEALMKDCAFALVQQLSPIPRLLKDLLAKQPRLVSIVEDQFARTGLAAQLALYVAEHGYQSKFVVCAPLDFDFIVGGSPQEYERRWGLDSEGLLSRIRACDS